MHAAFRTTMLMRAAFLFSNKKEINLSTEEMESKCQVESK